MSGYQTILYAEDGPVGTLTLNRPTARNALSMALMEHLIGALDAINAAPAIRVVILAGAGAAFCAGHDLREMRESPAVTHEALFATCSALMLRITTLRCPVIAQVHGIATAAGCQLAATCDLVVAADTARFATPGVNIGLFCSTPMVALTRVIGRKAAMAMLLTGEAIDAAEALAAAAATLAGVIAGKSAHTVAIGKQAFYRQAEMGLEDAYAFTAAVMTRNMQSADATEGISAFLEKRPPAWTDC